MKRHLFAWGLMAALAVPARADIVDSGSLQIGGQGQFGGTVTVQGNALGVAGAVSATSVTLSGSGANVYSLTASSGIHIINGKLKLDAGAMIEWADGTTSVSSAASGGSVAYATMTISSDKTNNTLLGPCIAGSTLTIATSGRPVLVNLVARYFTVNTSEYPLVSILRDGAFLGGTGSSTPIQTGEPANQAINPFGVPFLDVVGAGSHSYCITVGAGGGGTGKLAAPINFSVIEL